MKINYTQLLLYFMVCCSLFILSNCKDDCKEEKIYMKNYYHQMPYFGNDTLRFLRNNTDTQVFIGQGLERYFIPQEIKGECTKYYEALRIRFKNEKENDDLVLEYYYDLRFYDKYFKFFYKDTAVGPPLNKLYDKFMVNGKSYDFIILYSNSEDTLTYLAYTRFTNNGYNGILKIKYPGDTLTIIP